MLGRCEFATEYELCGTFLGKLRRRFPGHQKVMHQSVFNQSKVFTGIKFRLIHRDARIDENPKGAFKPSLGESLEEDC
jgi:hypothetical protein